MMTLSRHSFEMEMDAATVLHLHIPIVQFFRLTILRLLILSFVPQSNTRRRMPPLAPQEPCEIKSLVALCDLSTSKLYA
jgi:hypothetical protein